MLKDKSCLLFFAFKISLSYQFLLVLFYKEQRDTRANSFISTHTSSKIVYHCLYSKYLVCIDILSNNVIYDNYEVLNSVTKYHNICKIHYI